MSDHFDLLNMASLDLLRRDWRQAKDVVAELHRLAKEDDDPRWLGTALLRMGEYHQCAGDFTKARRLIGRAAKIVRGNGGDPAIEAVIRRDLGRMLVAEGRFDEALTELEPALELARSVGEMGEVAELYRQIGNAWRYMGNYSCAIDMLFTGLHIVSSMEDRKGEVRFLNSIAIIYCALEDWENALDYYTRYLAASRAAADRAGEGVALMNIGGVYLSQMRIPESIETLREALAIIRQIGIRENEAGALTSLGKAYGLTGRYADALECYAEAERLYNDMESRMGATLIALYTGELHGIRGEWEKALEFILRAMESARAIGYARVEYMTHRMAAEVYEELGDIPRSLHHYKTHLHLARELDGPDVRHRLTEGERQAERERVERENEAYREKIAKLESEMEGRQQELVSMALRVVRRDEFIDGIREQVVEYARSGQNMPTLATDLLRRMKAEGKEGDDQWQLFEGQFNRLYHGFTTTLLRKYHLTPTELKVCMLLRTGFATKEVADILHIAIHTVETHRRRIRKKLGMEKEGNLVGFLGGM